VRRALEMDICGSTKMVFRKGQQSISASAFVNLGVRLCTYKVRRNRSISRVRRGLHIFVVDDVVSDGGALCSGVCLLVGGATSSHWSCQRDKESADIIGVYTVSRGGKWTYYFVMSRSRSAALVAPRGLVFAASNVSESSFSASARAFSSANCVS
jgi:hypothetical protein